MQVIIDGVEYAPKNGKITVHGIEYENIPNWFYNIHSVLISDWINAIMENGGTYCKGFDSRLDALHDKIAEFERFCEEYLGFKYNKEKYNYEEVEYLRL